jgi:hypothetical protein
MMLFCYYSYCYLFMEVYSQLSYYSSFKVCHCRLSDDGAKIHWSYFSVSKTGRRTTELIIS